MKIYLLPGLGFDCRIFQHLEFGEIKTVDLNWIEPSPEEKFSEYAKRVARNIEPDSPKNILIGHSLGGMLAQEIAQFQKIDAIILISSIRSRTELPFQFKIVKPLHLYAFFSRKMAVQTVKYWGKFHDYETPEEQALFKTMVSERSDHYLKWALKTLSIWQTPKLSTHTRIFQIHGALDTTFPIKLIEQPNFILKKAGHFMVFKHPKTIQKRINDFLELI